MLWELAAAQADQSCSSPLFKEAIAANDDNIKIPLHRGAYALRSGCYVVSKKGCAGTLGQLLYFEVLAHGIPSSYEA
jgi:hypothetical protein